MNQGGHGSVSSSLGAGTKQCSWSLPAATASKQSNPNNTLHQMNNSRPVGQNISTAMYTNERYLILAIVVCGLYSYFIN